MKETEQLKTLMESMIAIEDASTDEFLNPGQWVKLGTPVRGGHNANVFHVVAIAGSHVWVEDITSYSAQKNQKQYKLAIDSVTRTMKPNTANIKNTQTRDPDSRGMTGGAGRRF